MVITIFLLMRANCWFKIVAVKVTRFAHAFSRLRIKHIMVVLLYFRVLAAERSFVWNPGLGIEAEVLCVQSSTQLATVL